MFQYEDIQKLNELELSLYEYIMINSEKVMYMKIRELANEAHVSTTTILRFCKKINCEGFSEFKLKFKMYMEEKNHKKVNEDISVIIDNFRKMSQVNFNDKIDQLCELIKEHDKVTVLGGGLSGIVAKYGARYLSSIVRFTSYIDDLLFPINCEYYRDGLLIVVSVSGETREIINAVAQFKKEKCAVVSITNSENCTLAKMSDLNIAYYILEERIGDVDITTHLPAMYIFEAVGKRIYNERMN